MTVATQRKTAIPLAGVSRPRIAPPLPAISLVEGFQAEAASMGIEPMEHQLIAARYLNARGDKKWLYREVAILMARQNGKTSLLKPLIRQRLRMGRRMLHTAQNREIPRELFLDLTGPLWDDPWVKDIRAANGQESITVHAEGCDRRAGKRCGCRGGYYTLVAPRPGVRGHSMDDVLLDEVREQRTNELVTAVKPTLTASRDPQIIYLSNAGDDTSVVLNDLRRRSELGSERLAYLEWSAAPERSIDDRAGWAEANPALGQTIDMDTLEAEYESMDPAGFETEHLCRWAEHMAPRLVSQAAWDLCRASISENPVRPAIAFNMSPNGSRASAVMSWMMTDGRIALVELEEATGDPIDVKALGERIAELVHRHGVRKVAHASWTDKDLARYVPRSDALDGKDYANASENFARLVMSGRLAWADADHISNDLIWTARKPHQESGAWMAVPATPDRAVTGLLAAVRATWLASAPKPALPRIG